MSVVDKLRESPIAKVIKSGLTKPPARQVDLMSFDSCDNLSGSQPTGEGEANGILKKVRNSMLRIRTRYP